MRFPSRDRSTVRGSVPRTLETVLSSVFRVTEAAFATYGKLPVLCAGGVMCNTIIRREMEARFSASFADAIYSADNASGTAVLTYLRHKRAEETHGN